MLASNQGASTPGPRTVYVGDAKTGELWRVSEWRKIVTGKASKGSLLRVFNAAHSASSTVAADGTLFVRPVPFACIASSCEMPFGPPPVTSGNSLEASAGSAFLAAFAFVIAAVDQRGHLYALDMPKNRFWLVARTGVSAVCITFNTVRRREVILGLSDNSIHCYNIDTNQLVARLPAYHRTEPQAISVHPNFPIAISNSRTESIIWDTERWERKRVLMGAGPGVQQASFSRTDTFNLRWKISLERFAANPTDRPTLPSDSQLVVPRSSYFSVSSNDELMIYGGLSASLYVWNLTEKRLLHEILLPAFSKRVLAQVEFVGTTSVAAVLSSGGELVLVDVERAKMIGQFRGSHRFRSFSLSHDGSVMTVILMDAKFSLRMMRIDQMVKLRGKVNDGVDRDLDDDLLEEAEAPKEESRPASPMKRVQLQSERTKTFYEMIEAKESTTVLNRRKLLKYLKHYGSYPEDYRTMIWRFLLKLPENREAYETLLEKGIHPSLKDFRKKFPLKSDRIAKSMERTISCLAHWSPIFEDLEYLPGMVFPIVKLFVNDMFSGFEVIMSLLINWCQKWWEYYPNPPIECLGVLEDLIAYHDPPLLSHFKRQKITSQVYGWGLLQTLLTEILSQRDWLKVWDHLVTNPPAFLYYFIAAYILESRASLLAANKLDDVSYFFSRVNPVNVDKIIVAAYRLHSATPDACSPVTFFTPFRPLLKGQYEIFNKYPEFIVNYQSKMKEKIRADEVEYLRRRRLAVEVSKLGEELKRDKQAWETADWKMNDMVESWWESMMGAEETHNDRLARLDASEKEQRIRSLKRIAEARKTFVDHHLNTTKNHALNIAKTVGVNRKDVESRLNETDSDAQFKQLENEWIARKEEMLSARQELSKLDHTRAERLIRHARDLGVPTHPFDLDLDSTPGKFNAPETERLRNARREGFRDPSVSPTRVRPRAWSPELLEERRHRRSEVARSVDISDGPSPVRSESEFLERVSEDLAGSPGSRRSVRFQ
ncbi:hypothetical protein BC830DRAFT_1157806 [Chytriomyces sp. MP71]|nr:hypothetical protein BC830DRAFT_1157806 [Chytriomyces sp. MP71]